MFTVLVTGIVGLDREELFAKVAPERVLCHDLGWEMTEIAKERLLAQTGTTLLSAPSATLAALRIAAIERLVRQEPQARASGKIRIISAHALFQLRGRIQEGLSRTDLAMIQPDLVITLIDAPQRIHDRLKAEDQEQFHMTIEAVIRWQEFEVFFTNQLAREQKVAHYVVPVNQPESFTRLIMGDNRPIVYASYPTGVLPPEQRAHIQGFLQRLKEECIVFDPAAVESRHASKPYYAPSDHRAIQSHAAVRDLDWFIGINAQAVVAYLPSMLFSSGMNEELRYAYENGRETYLVAEALNPGAIPGLSPITAPKSKLFWSSDDFFAYLKLEPDMQHAFLVIQNEAHDLLRAVRESGKAPTKADFRIQCRLALNNAKPDDWVKARTEALDKLADRTHDRWMPTLRAIREAPSTPIEPERFVAAAIDLPKEPLFVEEVDDDQNGA